MRPVVFIILISALFRTYAQEGPFPSSGLGIILPRQGITELYLHFPLAEIQLYNSVGQKCGILYKKDIINLMFSLDNRKAYRVHDKDLAEVERKGFCLKFFARKGDFVKVLVHSVRNGCWISLSELNYLRYESKSWLEVLTTKKTYFYPAVDVGINLRKEPDVNSKKITLLKGKKTAIKLTGKTSGLWAEVKAERFSRFPCSSETAEKPLETFTGWIKAIDDAGYPNIWFFPEGCN